MEGGARVRARRGRQRNAKCCLGLRLAFPLTHLLDRVQVIGELAEVEREAAPGLVWPLRLAGLLRPPRSRSVGHRLPAPSVEQKSGSSAHPQKAEIKSVFSRNPDCLAGVGSRERERERERGFARINDIECQGPGLRSLLIQGELRPPCLAPCDFPFSCSQRPIFRRLIRHK